MAVPPANTVTFLFTDIEGSTKMWERDPRGMRAALARHDEIVRGAIEAREGYVFNTVGDAFCAAFADAYDAVGAAQAAQRALFAEGRALFAEGRAEDFAIKARMALHTGTAEESGGDYFGPPLNRVARLLSAGHGGQVLLSLPTRELVRDRLPEDTDLRDLGERRLKDLFRPERVFQLISPDLPSSFPPLRTLDARLNNLPFQPTPLVGREKEVAEVCGQLRRAELRLLTLTGPGGTGKTRLGLQGAAELLDEFEDGVFFVALASITDPALVAPTVAGALDVREISGRPVEERLKDFLRNKEMLLVLDNFEQVVEAAPLVGSLLASCPGLKVLTTSRAALRLYGEHELPVPPLAVADTKRLPEIRALAQYGAVRLFIDRAQDVKPDFAITNENAPAVAEICARLDGLPLAIELVATRIKLLPPEALLGRLSNRLKLLTGGARDLPARHQTLRGAIEWSHDLLDEGEKTLFARLAVFSGGRTLEAIEAVCDAADDLSVDVLDGVSSLLDKSLLRQEEGPEGEVRFVMLETIHEFARERLEESGEAEEIRRLHAAFFLDLAEQANQRLRGPQQVRWLETLTGEHDNLRAAMAWLLEKGERGTAVRFGWALWMFWWIRGHFTEGRSWMEKALAKGSAMRASDRAKALFVAGTMAAGQADYRSADVLVEESKSLFEELGDEEGVALALGTAGIAAVSQKRYERGIALLEKAAGLHRELGYEWETAAVIGLLAGAWLGLGDHGRAEQTAEEGLALGRKVGEKTVISVALFVLATVAHASDDHQRAKKLFEEGLRFAAELRDAANIVYYLEGLAAFAASEDKPRRAARLWGAAEALLEAIEATAYTYRADRSLYQGQVSAARARLDETSWTAAWSEGRAMSSEQAVEYALSGEEPTPPAASAPEEQAIGTQPSALTRREQEVANLLGRRSSGGGPG